MAILDTLTQKVNILPTGIPTPVHLSQSENGRTLSFEIIGGSGELPAGSVVTLTGTKPDGVVYSAVGTLSGNIATFEEDVQLTAAAGVWPAKIEVTNGGHMIATGRISFTIDADPVAPGSVPSESELDGLVAQAAMYAETARSAAYGSPLTAATAADMIDTTRVYVYTGNETGMENGHWYYWEDGAWKDGGIYNAAAVQTDTSLSIPGMAADAKATGEAIAAEATAREQADTALQTAIDTKADTSALTAETAAREQADADLKADLYEIRTPSPNTVYVTEFANYKYAAGVYCSYVDPTTIKLWGTAGSWVRFNLLNGNSQVIAGAPTFTNDIAQGTYTLKASDALLVYYGVDWASRQMWANGASVTFDNPTTIFFAVSSSSQNFGTEAEPTYFSIEIYEGAVSTEPSAVDNVSRTAIGKTNCDNILVHGDFDYDKPYNIFNGSTFTENSKINYYDGAVNADSEGRLVTDYIEIDPSKGYLCVDIYVMLNGEGGTLVNGGNRVWVKNNCAFYDANKTYIPYISDINTVSKAIPSTAKYVRLTINKQEMIPFAVLYYGEYTTQQWVRYTAYRKDVKEASVYASTGMESLKMVMFGDSITHGLAGVSDNISYVDYANDMLRSNIINCGLGGSRMSQGQPDTIGLGSFASLCENITSTESTAWDALDTYASSSHTDWAGHVNALKTVDWSTVNAVGILYGANDWHNNVPVGTEYNENPLNYDGACAYGLKLLLTKYPHLQVIIFTPFFRVIDENTNSDANNSAGLNMDAYGESLKNILPVLHCPIVDSGNELGINRYTIYSYAPVFDGTHPRKVLGQRRIGKFVAEAIKRFIAPF